MWNFPSFLHNIQTLKSRLATGGCTAAARRTYNKPKKKPIIPSKDNPVKIIPRGTREIIYFKVDGFLEKKSFDELNSIYRKQPRIDFCIYAKHWSVDVDDYDDFFKLDVPEFRKQLSQKNFVLERLPLYEGDCEITKTLESIGFGLFRGEIPVTIVRSGNAFLITNPADAKVDKLIDNQLTGVTESILYDDTSVGWPMTSIDTYRTYDVWLVAEFLGLMEENHNSIPLVLCERTRTTLESRFDERQAMQRPIPELVDGHAIDLYPHQNEGVRFLQRSNGRCILAFEMGLGKTLTTLAYIALEGKRAVVVCPKHVRTHWDKDATRFLSGYFEGATVILGAKEGTTREELANAKLVSVNHESFRKFLPLIRESGNFDCLVLDESHLLKNPKAQRTKLVLECKDQFESRILLSGTPIKNQVNELTTQLEILGSQVEELDMKSPGAVWNLLHENNIYLQKAIKKVFPHLTFQEPAIVDVGLGDDDVKYFDTNWYEGDMRLQVQKKVTQIALTKTERTSSFALEKLAENLDDKIIIFTERISAADAILSILESTKPGVALMHHGDMEDSDRLDVIETFRQRQGETRILVSTRPSLAVGVNLQCANVVIFNDMPWSPADIRQASGRVRRLNQKKQVQEFWMQATADFDRNLMAKLRDKLSLIMQYAEGKNLPDEDLKWMNKKITIYDIVGIEKPKPKAKRKKKQS